MTHSEIATALGKALSLRNYNMGNLSAMSVKDIASKFFHFLPVKKGRAKFTTETIVAYKEHQDYLSK